MIWCNVHYVIHKNIKYKNNKYKGKNKKWNGIIK